MHLDGVQAPPAAQTTAAPGTGTGQASPYTASGSNTGNTVTSSTGQQQQQQQQYAGASGYQGRAIAKMSVTWYAWHVIFNIGL